MSGNIAILITPMSMALPRAIHWLVVTVVFLSILAGITSAFYVLDWSWTVYGVLIGAIFGLVVGVAVLVKVSTKVQIAVVGAVTGMGADLLVTATQAQGPKTAITSIATLVANVIGAATSAAQQTGLPHPSETPLAVGLWVFAGVLGILMLFGALEERTS
jgi:hypothetical protein